MDQPYLSIIIPAYNEAQRIGKSLERIREYLSRKPFATELIVVDDGSTDSTPALLETFAAVWPELRILRNDPNQGKGYSVRRGALEARAPYILFTDADRLLAAMESTEADAAIGSRALKRELIGIHQPKFREWGGILFNWVVRLLTGLAIHDTQCGFKLFRRETTRRAFEFQTVFGFGFDPELLFLIRRSGGRILEIPVRWNNDPATKVRFLRDSSRMLLDLVKLRWHTWKGMYEI